MRLQLEVIDEETGQARTVEVDPVRPAFALGRDPSNDLVLASPSVSRRHCRFECADATWSVADLGSSLGTVHNGVKLAPHTPTHLADGDLLVCADQRIRVHLLPDAPFPAPDADPLLTAVLPRAEPLPHVETSRAASGEERREERPEESPEGSPEQEATPVPPGARADHVESRAVEGPAESAPRVWVFSAGSAPTSFVLAAEGDALTVGRATECAVRLPDPYRVISSQHARVERNWAGVYLFDTSVNGVFVNGTRLQGQGQLRDGDRITFAVAEESPELPLFVFAAEGNTETPEGPSRSEVAERSPGPLETPDARQVVTASTAPPHLARAGRPAWIPASIGWPPGGRVLVLLLAAACVVLLLIVWGLVRFLR